MKQRERQLIKTKALCQGKEVFGVKTGTRKSSQCLTLFGIVLDPFFDIDTRKNSLLIMTTKHRNLFHAQAQSVPMPPMQMQSRIHPLPYQNPPSWFSGVARERVSSRFRTTPILDAETTHKSNNVPSQKIPASFIFLDEAQSLLSHCCESDKQSGAHQSKENTYRWVRHGQLQENFTPVLL